MVYCGYELVDPDQPSGTTRKLVRPKPDMQGDVLDYALRTELDPACTPTMLIRRSVIEDVRPLGNNHGADVIGLLIELAQRTEFTFVDDSLVTVRRGETHSSYSDFPSVPQGLRQVLKEYRDIYESTDPSNYCYAKARYHRRMSVGILEKHVWSATAIAHAIKTAYYSPDGKVKPVVRVIGTLAGRPGIKLLERIQSTIQSS